MREQHRRSISGDNLHALGARPYHEHGLRHVRSESHISRTEVESVLSGLADNTVIVLPKTCCDAAGLVPNINDKQQPKNLWIGRLKHLNRLLSATALQQAVQPQEVRRSFLQAALDTVECRHPAAAEIPMQLAQLPGWKLQQMAHAAIVIQKMWRGRRARQANSLNVLEAFKGCITKGYVVFLCGSTGIAGDSLRYVRMLAGMGYLVIAPDDLAGTSPLRRRRARLIIRPDEATDYWERNLLYEDDGAEGELVYVSTSESVLASPDHFDQIYSNIITVRQAELAFTLRRLPSFLKRQGVFLFGMSEGAVTLSTFNDEYFAGMIRGRVLASYSCEMNYWNYNRPEDVGIAGSSDVPTLNLMGFEDEYFGVNNSVASTVAACGDFPPIVGHAFQQMVERGIQWGLSCHFEGGHHSLLLTHDDVIREILSDFLVRPLTTCRSLAVLWGNLADLQDEITRVRRSLDERVLYVRIRPPHSSNLPPPSSQLGRRREALLDALSARLYEVENSDGNSLAGAVNWADLRLTPPHSPPGAREVPSNCIGRGDSSPHSSLTPEGSSLDGATPTAAGVAQSKSRARAATARMLAHFSFRSSSKSLASSPRQPTLLPEGSFPPHTNGGTLPSSTPSSPPAAAPARASSDQEAAAAAAAAASEAAVERWLQDSSAQEVDDAPGASPSSDACTATATGANSAPGASAAEEAAPAAAVAADNTLGAGLPGPPQPNGDAAENSEQPGSALLSSPGHPTPVALQQQQQQQQEEGGGAAVSALSAALRGAQLSSGKRGSGVKGGSPVNQRVAALAGLGSAPELGSRAAWGLGAAAQEGASKPGQQGVLATGASLSHTAAEELNFSPVQRLLASSLASDRATPFPSPSRSDREGILPPWQRPPSASKGTAGQPRRTFHSRSLSASAAAAAAGAGSAPGHHQSLEEFEAGLETLQDWMQSQGHSSPVFSPPAPGSGGRHSPHQQQQQPVRPDSALSSGSGRRRSRSVHFSQPLAQPGCGSASGSSSSSAESSAGSRGGGSSGEESDAEEEEEGRRELRQGSRRRRRSGGGRQGGRRTAGQTPELLQLAQALAVQAQAAAKASEAAAYSARTASWVAAGSLASLVALAFVAVRGR